MNKRRSWLISMLGGLAGIFLARKSDADEDTFYVIECRHGDGPWNQNIFASDTTVLYPAFLEPQDSMRRLLHELRTKDYSIAVRVGEFEWKRYSTKELEFRIAELRHSGVVRM